MLTPSPTSFFGAMPCSRPQSIRSLVPGSRLGDIFSIMLHRSLSSGCLRGDPCSGAGAGPPRNMMSLLSWTILFHAWDRLSSRALGNPETIQGRLRVVSIRAVLKHRLFYTCRPTMAHYKNALMAGTNRCLCMPSPKPHRLSSYSLPGTLLGVGWLSRTARPFRFLIRFTFRCLAVSGAALKPSTRLWQQLYTMAVILCLDTTLLCCGIPLTGSIVGRPMTIGLCGHGPHHLPLCSAIAT